MALNWALFCRRTSRLGAHTFDERAELVGTSRSSLNRWKAGDSHPGVDKAIEIADLLGVTVTKLWVPQATAGARS